MRARPSRRWCREHRAADRELPSRGSRGSEGSLYPSAPEARESAGSSSVAPVAISSRPRLKRGRPLRERRRSRARSTTTLACDEVDAVAGSPLRDRRKEISGRHPVTGEIAVHVGRGCVARGATIDDGDAPAGAAEDERGAETGRAAANHDYVIACRFHGRDAAEGASASPLSLLFPGTVRVA